MIRRRNGLIALSLLTGGCAMGGVRTPEQATAIALSSPCARQKPILAAHEQPATEWLAERRGDRWYAWLPYGPGAQLVGGNGQFPAQYGHMGAWIDPKDGKVLACERGGAEP
ncbi:MAG TPA: hypothetical protein VFI23_16530 [Rhizomicrobium sp.]|nr:hypothetical protein [Rhizomicrobium sp.]